MAITSAGYDGSVNEPEWSDLLSMAGGRQYGVLDPDSWRATVGAAVREVRLSPGRGFGYGIRDASDSVVSLTLPAVASGSRWDLITMRRDWGSNASTFTVVGGSAAKELPTRKTTPALLDDQPLWLARVQAGNTQVQELIDLRVWGGDGGSLALDELVLQYLNRIGTEVRINGTSWTRILDSLGNPKWTSSGLAREAYQYNAVEGGGIIQRGTVAGAGSMTTARLIPAGSLMQVSFSCQIYCPGVPGYRNNNYGGVMTVHRGSTELARRRWHNHGVEAAMLNPSALFQWVVPEDIPANTTFNLGVSNDPNAAGGVELWDVFASWSILRP